MIVSHKHRFIFLKTKKTAGTSFEIALRKYIGAEDIVTPISESAEQLCAVLGHPSAQNYIIQEKQGTVRLYNHASATLVRRALGDEIWKSYFKFSIIRNPFDCLVSNYYWGIRNKRIKPSFKEWVFMNPGVLVENEKIVSDGLRIGLDLLLRYESFKEDVAHLEQKLPALDGLFETFSSIRAKGDVRPKSSNGSTRELFFSNPEVAQLVYLLRGDEISKYKYHPG